MTAFPCFWFSWYIAFRLVLWDRKYFFLLLSAATSCKLENHHLFINTFLWRRPYHMDTYYCKNYWTYIVQSGLRGYFISLICSIRAFYFRNEFWFLIHIGVLDCRVTEFNSVKTNDHWTKSDSVDRWETGCIYSICQAGYVHSLAKSNAYVNNTAMYNLNKHPEAFFREYIVVISRAIFDCITLWNDTCVRLILFLWLHIKLGI